MAAPSDYPPLADYALIGDCHGAALVSRSGSIDWCCLPRFDSGSCFGRLLDWDRGGYCKIEPVGEEHPSFREYLADTLVLATTFRTGGGQARLLDCFVLGDGEERQLLRIVEGERGAFEFGIRIAPRFDYAETTPWIRHHGQGVYSAIGGDDGLVIWCDAPLEVKEGDGVEGRATVRPGERIRLAVSYRPPETIDAVEPQPPEPEEIDRRLEDTVASWRTWAGKASIRGPDAPGAERSAIVLKALSYAPTGALVAAATTSLPETIGGARNWDYRYSWVRDSGLAVRSLAELGYENEAHALRGFIERSAGGGARDLQIAYGVGGERRLVELELGLDGYRGSGPVRVGNDAIGQLQLDAYGQLVEQSWRWFQRGHSPDDDYWRFLVELVETAVERWREPDHGIWEWRGEPRHFVHSKAHCWLAAQRGLELAEACMRKAPEHRWRQARDEVLEAIESQGYDSERGVFVQAFDHPELDAALLRLPILGFLDWRDERMIRTTDAIRDELDADGLLYRHRTDDGLEGQEAPFVPCSFWLVECLARQDRLEEARAVFDRTITTANGVGLFSEMYDPAAGELLGNFPLALTHLSHIEAALALSEHGAMAGDSADASELSDP